MLGNLVPGSHLLLIWDVPGFIVCFQGPAGFEAGDSLEQFRALVEKLDLL